MIDSKKNQSGAALVGVVLILFVIALIAFIIMMSLALPIAVVKKYRDVGRTLVCSVKVALGGEECEFVSDEPVYTVEDYERILKGEYKYGEECTEEGCWYDGRDREGNYVEYLIPKKDVEQYKLVKIPKEMSVLGERRYVNASVLAGLMKAWEESKIFLINSAFRIWKHQKEVSWADYSNHMNGTAVDVTGIRGYKCTFDEICGGRAKGCCSEEIVELLSRKALLIQTESIRNNDPIHFSVRGD